MTQQRHYRGRHGVLHHHPLDCCLPEWELHQRRPALSTYLRAFMLNILLTCRRACNPWRSPVCSRGPAFAWGPCCSPRRATRLACPSCMLVNGTRRWDGVRTRAHSHSLSFLLSLPVTNTRLPDSSVCDVTRSIQEAGGWWGGW